MQAGSYCDKMGPLCGRQFVTILSINKTRDENKCGLNVICWAHPGGAPFFRLEVMKMDMKNLSKTQKLCFSGAVMAIYILLMYLTQSFAFGQYQVRIATAIYSVAYLFEFLVVPLALANLLSNLLMGGFGFFDIVGGGLVGLLTAGCCAWLGKHRLSRSLTAVPIALIPALGVASWLSYLLSVPYWVMAGSLMVGQLIAGIAGALLTGALWKIWKFQ